MDILRKIPELGKIIKLPEDVVAAYLRVKHPELTPEDHGIVLQAVRKRAEMFGDQPSIIVDYPVIHRQIFTAAAWLLGASQTQLARMFGVRQQTIQKHVSLELPMANRADLRLEHRSPIPVHLLEGYRENFFSLIADSPRIFSNMAPLEVAKLLKDMPISTVADPDELEPAYREVSQSQ